jgi:hypothetical protein
MLYVDLLNIISFKQLFFIICVQVVTTRTSLSPIRREFAPSFVIWIMTSFPTIWIWILVFKMPLLAIFQLYHGNQFYCWRKLERTTDPGQATGKLYHLWLRVECTFFYNLQSWVRTHAVLVIGLYELLLLVHI